MTQTDYVYSDLLVGEEINQVGEEDTGVAPLTGLKYIRAREGGLGGAYYSQEKQYEPFLYGVIEGWFYISTLTDISVTMIGMLGSLDETQSGVAYGLYMPGGSIHIFSAVVVEGNLGENSETIDITEVGDISEQWFRLRVSISAEGVTVEIYDSEGSLLAGDTLTTLSSAEGTNGFYLVSDVNNFVLLDSTSIDNA